MLIPNHEIRYDLLYMGPGKGCRHVMRCDAIGFRKEIDCNRQHESRLEALEELQQTVFDRFRTGHHRFEPPEKQTVAERIIELPDSELIERMYVQDHFERELVRRELIHREIMDEDIYRIGLFGNDLAVAQAIELLKTKAERMS